MTSYPTARPPLSVVIPTRNRPADLTRCLELLSQAVHGDDEILVVDSASSDDQTQRVAAQFGVRCVRVDQPGASRARNVGWRAARHDCVAFVDDDVRVDPTWADQMACALSEPDVWFVTGWIGATGPPQQDPLPLTIDPLPRRLDRTAPGGFGASANVGARREALHRVGGFDERLGPATWFAAAEDAELFDRFVHADLLGKYSPDVKVDHEHDRSRTARLRLHWSYGKGNGARIFLLLRHDRARARRIARHLLWERGVVQILTRLRQRWAMGVACSLLRLSGAVVAFGRAAVALRAPWSGG